MSITYKQLQDSWIISNLVDSFVEDYGIYEDIYFPSILYFGTVTIEDVINKNITKDNYLDIIKLVDYFMVLNVDVIIDEIVRIFDDIDIVYTFENFYKLSERLQPLTKEQLREQIKNYDCEKKIEMFYKYGHSSFWNISEIKDMSNIFIDKYLNNEYNVELELNYLSNNIDISRWDVSNVTNMSSLFHKSNFNGDISQWDVSSVGDMSYMFSGSKFTGDISRWDVSNVKNMSGMFDCSIFNNDISEWDVSNVEDMSYIFSNCEFNINICNWNVSNVKDMTGMFRYNSRYIHAVDNIFKCKISNVMMGYHQYLFQNYHHHN